MRVHYTRQHICETPFCQGSSYLYTVIFSEIVPEDESAYRALACVMSCYRHEKE
jgi:hypothetical protein